MKLRFFSILNFLMFINLLIAQHGTLDESFAGFPPLGTFHSPIKKIRLQLDGKIIGIGDRYYGWITPDYSTILRLDQNGEVDYSFNSGTGFSGDPYDLDIQHDGKIIVTGSFSSFNGTNVKNIARLNADGSLDSTFNVDLDSTFNVDSIIVVSPRAVELQSDGKIIVVGEYFHFDNGTLSTTTFVKRLNTNGSLDPSFHLEVDSVLGISDFLVQADDKILLNGGFNINGDSTVFTMLRFFSDGSLDPSFSIGTGPDIFPGPPPYINNIALQPDGKLIVTGRFSSFNGVERNGIIRLHSDGSPDLSFDPGEGLAVIQNTCCLIYTISFKGNGKIFLGGDGLLYYDNYPTNGNFVLNPDGSLDTTYQGVDATYVSSSIILEDERYLIAGYLINGISFYYPYTYIARLNNEKSDITLTESITLGSNISIYPNPFDNYFFIESQNNQFKGTCHIYNYLGELVYSNQISSQIAQIDFTPYPAGLYFVLIKGEQGESSYKIIKR